jgi:probable O-glycosylation ligase (exosortase A-associated)
MRDIALALFILGMIPYILMRPFIGLLIWSWLGYMNPHRLCYGFAYSFPWVMLIALVTLVSLVISKESRKIPLTAVSVLLLVFLAWTGVSTSFAAVPHAAWEKWEEFAKVLVMVFVTLMLVNNRERMHWLVWMIVVSLGFYGVKGGVFTLLHGGTNSVLGPPNSFIADNNAMALALCMVLPFMRYLQLCSSRKYVRVGLGVAMLLTGVSILGTYSRGGLLALAVVAGALFLKSRRRLAVVAVVAVVVVAAWSFMPPQWTARMETLQHAAETGSGETRIQSYKFALNVAVHRPLVGGGFDDYKSAPLWQAYAPADAEQRAIHSIYLRTLGEQGFPGLVLYLALLLVSWRNCRRVRRQTAAIPEMKWAFDLASMLQVGLVAFMAAGTFLPMPYFDLTFQLMALSAVLLVYCTQAIRERQGVGADSGAASTNVVATPSSHAV